MTPSSDLPSWARLADMATASQWWNQRRDRYPPACLTLQAALTVVGATVRQGHALLQTETDFQSSLACQGWAQEVTMAWEVVLLATAHAQLQSRVPDNTPPPSMGLVAANQCAHDVYRLASEPASKDLATALLRLEAIYAHVLQAAFLKAPSTESPSNTLAVLRQLLERLGDVSWTLERQLPWFASPANPA